MVKGYNDFGKVKVAGSRMRRGSVNGVMDSDEEFRTRYHALAFSWRHYKSKKGTKQELSRLAKDFPYMEPPLEMPQHNEELLRDLARVFQIEQRQHRN